MHGACEDTSVKLFKKEKKKKKKYIKNATLNEWSKKKAKKKKKKKKALDFNAFVWNLLFEICLRFKYKEFPKLRADVSCLTTFDSVVVFLFSSEFRFFFFFSVYARGARRSYPPSYRTPFVIQTSNLAG